MGARRRKGVGHQPVPDANGYYRAWAIRDRPGAKPLEGEIVYFETYDASGRCRCAQVKGKIVFVDHQMKRTQDGSSYGQFGRARFIGPNVAAKKGALAIVIRSIGTDSHRNPHTGNTNFEAGVTPIPAGALSNPDADNLVRQIKRAPSIPLPGSSNAWDIRRPRLNCAYC